MRLLNVHSLKLQEYQEPRIPSKYAIASHRWFTDEEATIEDVRMIEDVRRKRDCNRSGVTKVKDSITVHTSGFGCHRRRTASVAMRLRTTSRMSASTGPWRMDTTMLVGIHLRNADSISSSVRLVKSRRIPLRFNHGSCGITSDRVLHSSDASSTSYASFTSSVIISHTFSSASMRGCSSPVLHDEYSCSMGPCIEWSSHASGSCTLQGLARLHGLARSHSLARLHGFARPHGPAHFYVLHSVARFARLSTYSVRTLHAPCPYGCGACE